MSIVRSKIVLFVLPIHLLFSCHKNLSSDSTASGFQLPCFRRLTPRELVVKRPSDAPKVAIKSERLILKNTDPNRRPGPQEQKALAHWVDSQSFYSTIVPLSENEKPIFNYLEGVDAQWKDKTKYGDSREFLDYINDLANSGVGEGVVYRGEPEVSLDYALSLVNHVEHRTIFEFSPPGRKLSIPIPSSTRSGVALGFACPSVKHHASIASGSPIPQSIGLVFRIKTSRGYQLPSPFDRRESEVLLPAALKYRVTKMQAFDLGDHNQLLRGELKDLNGKIIVKRLRRADICYPILVDLVQI